MTRGFTLGHREQCLERRKETASYRARAARMVAARIQGATRIRCETAASYLKAAGIAVRSPGGWGRIEPENRP
jgi:hypothetical protein